MSQFKVYTETGINSIAFDTLEAAKEWAHETNCWFEVVDLVKNDIVYTAEDYQFSRFYNQLAAIAA